MPIKSSGEQKELKHLAKMQYNLNLTVQHETLTAYYNKYCKILKSVVLEAKRSCIEREIMSAQNVKKATWSVLNREINRNTVVNPKSKPFTIKDNDTEVTHPNQKGHKLNEYFIQTTRDLSVGITKKKNSSENVIKRNILCISCTYNRGGNTNYNQGAQTNKLHRY